MTQKTSIEIITEYNNAKKAYENTEVRTNLESATDNLTTLYKTVEKYAPYFYMLTLKPETLLNEEYSIIKRYEFFCYHARLKEDSAIDFCVKVYQHNEARQDDYHVAILSIPDSFLSNSEQELAVKVNSVINAERAKKKAAEDLRAAVTNKIRELHTICNQQLPPGGYSANLLYLTVVSADKITHVTQNQGEDFYSMLARYAITDPKFVFIGHVHSLPADPTKGWSITNF